MGILWASSFSRYQTEIEKARRLGNKKAFSHGLAMCLMNVVLLGSVGFAFWCVTGGREMGSCYRDAVCRFAGFLVYEELSTGGDVLAVSEFLIN